MSNRNTPERNWTFGKSSRSQSPKRSLSPNVGYSQSAKKVQRKLIQEFFSAQEENDSLVIRNKLRSQQETKTLIRFLREHPHYTSIDISGNNISSQNFALICEELKFFRNLQVLKVDQNEIGGDLVGVTALVDILSELPKLRVIDLRHNKIGKGSGQALARLVEEGKNLQKIDLRWNDISDKEAVYILEALRSNPRNIQISLGGNRLEGSKISNELLLGINAIAMGLDSDGESDAADGRDESYIKKKESRERQTESIKKRNKTTQSIDWSTAKKFSVHSSSISTKSHSKQPVQPISDFSLGVMKSKTPSKLRGQPKGYSTTSSKNNAKRKVAEVSISEKDLQKWVKSSETVRKLKQLLDEERERSANLAKLMKDQIEIELLYERKSTLEIENRNAALSKELKERDLHCNDLQISLKKIAADCSQLQLSNSQLSEELVSTRESLQSGKIKTIPGVQANQRDQLREELEEMKKEIACISETRDDTAMEDITNKWQQESEKLEKQVKSLRNEVQETLAHYHKSLKENEAQIRQKERAKYDKEIQKLESLYSNLKSEEDTSNRESEHLKIKGQNLRALNESLKTQLSESIGKNEKRREEIMRLDSKIAKLEEDLSQTYDETNQLDRKHRAELEALLAEHKKERTKWNDDGRVFNEVIQELGHDMNEAKQELLKYKNKFKILLDSLQTNVKDVISTTFSENEIKQKE